jgi:hypothetical protein
MTKFKLELLIPKMYLYVKFELNVYSHWEDNERKLKISDFLQSSKGITLSAIIKPCPNSNLTSVFLWHVHISNLSWICTTVWKIMNGNWKFPVFKIKGALLCQNHQTMTKFKLDLSISLMYPNVKCKLNVYCTTVGKIINGNWKIYQWA